MIRYKRAPSSDSEGSGHAGQAFEISHRSDLTGSESKRDQTASQRDSGHHDPIQRRNYLIVLGLSVSSALVGLVLLLTWMYKYRATTGLGIGSAALLSNLHPILMYSFMVSLNMYAVLIYRTHYSLPKDRLKWTHAILSAGNIVMSLLGVYAVYKSHLMNNIPNFYSLHSWIGAATNILYLSQFVAGFVAFLKPGLAANQRAALMPIHRTLGAMVLVLAATAAITGISEMVIFQDKDGVYSKFTAITFIANFAGVSIILMTALSIYLLTAPKYLRPALPEEEPLKR